MSRGSLSVDQSINSDNYEYAVSLIKWGVISKNIQDF